MIWSSSKTFAVIGAGYPTWKEILFQTILSNFPSLSGLMALWSYPRWGYMFKILALIVGGISLMNLGIYFLSIANLPAFQLPTINVNWAVVGFVAIVGSIVALGSAFVVSKLS